jgi:death-on-curing protein
VTEPDWVTFDVVLAIHDEQLAQHGGAAGVRDRGAVEAAVARPRHLFHYGQPDLADLTASLALGIAKGHGFVDGNKRVAFVAMATFLVLNGFDLAAPMAERVVAMQDLAGGEMSEAAFAAWLRGNITPRA